MHVRKPGIHHICCGERMIGVITASSDLRVFSALALPVPTCASSPTMQRGVRRA